MKVINFLTLLVVITIFSCSKHQHLSIDKLKNSDFLAQWDISSSTFIDSCSRSNTESPYLILIHSRESNLREKLIEYVIQEKGTQFQCNKIFILESSQFGTSHYYSAAIWFNDDDICLNVRISANGKLEKIEGLSKIPLLSKLEEMSSCCEMEKGVNHSFCTYYTTVENSSDSTFRISNFCIFYGEP